MKEYDLSEVILFRGMSQPEIRQCLQAMHAQTRHFEKGSILLHAGETTRRMGIVLSGSVTIESADQWGNLTILSHVGKNGFFAETYALLEGSVLLVDVRANEECDIMFLDVSCLRQPSEGDAWHAAVIANLLTISTQKNRTLSSRIFHTSSKSIRGRILSYLNTVSLEQKSRELAIPFDRQQLADYLNVDRTALSKELGRMQKEGLIRFRKNHFTIEGD